MKGKFALVTFLIMIIAIFGYLSMPQTKEVKEVVKEIKLETK